MEAPANKSEDAGQASTESDVARLFAGVRGARLDAPATVSIPQQTGEPPPLPYFGVNEHGVVITSRPCRSCGYDLRGLTMADACPECHWPVRRSVAAPLLVNSPPEHVQRLRTGLTIVLVAQLAGLLGGVAGFVAGAALTMGNLDRAEIFAVAGGVLFSVINLVGWWFFSIPDPALAPDEQRRNSRRVLRGFAAATIVGYLASLVVNLLNVQGIIPTGNPIMVPLGGTPLSIGTATSLAITALAGLVALLNVVVTSVAMAYLSNVCARIPDAGLQQDTRRMVWLVWVLLFVPCVGGMISYVMVLIYVIRARSALSGVLQHQRAMGV